MKKIYSLYKVHPAYDVPDCNYIYIVRTTLLSVQRISNKKGSVQDVLCHTQLSRRKEILDQEFCQFPIKYDNFMENLRQLADFCVTLAGKKILPGPGRQFDNTL
jgi:hypothetical protein